METLKLSLSASLFAREIMTFFGDNMLIIMTCLWPINYHAIRCVIVSRFTNLHVCISLALMQCMEKLNVEVA